MEAANTYHDIPNHHMVRRFTNDIDTRLYDSRLSMFSTFSGSPSTTIDVVGSLNKEKRTKRCGTICIKYIFNVPHMLLVRGKRTKIWSLPKGCINEGESEYVCAQRETFEESGLLLELNGSHPRICINHNIYFVVLINHHSKLKIRDKTEIDKVNWMTLEEIKALECNKDLRSIMQYPNRRFAFHGILDTYLAFESSPPPILPPVHLTLNVNVSPIMEQLDQISIPILPSLSLVKT